MYSGAEWQANLLKMALEFDAVVNSGADYRLQYL